MKESKDVFSQNTDRIDRLSVQIHTLTEDKQSLQNKETLLKSRVQALENDNKVAQQ